MRMRQKALAYLLVCGIIFVAFTAMIVAESVDSYFDNSEKRNSEIRAKVIGAVVGSDLERLAALAMSYGYWDDLRKYVLSKKSIHETAFPLKDFDVTEFMKTNFQNIKYAQEEKRHGIFVGDLNGEILFSDLMDQEYRRFIDPDPELTQLISPLLKRALDSSSAGILRRNDGTLIAASWSSIRSNGGVAEPIGVVAFYREYRPEIFDKLWTNLGFRFFLSDPAASEHGEKTMKVALGSRVAQRQQQHTPDPAAEENMRPGQAVNRTKVDFTPSFVTADSKQEWQEFGFIDHSDAWLFPYLHRERHFVLNAALLSVVCAIIVFSALIYAIIGHWMVRPTESLVNEIESMSRNPDRHARLSESDTKDEISDLKASFNRLLSELEIQENSLRRQDRLASLGTMLAEFSHEVANPLAALVAYCRRVREHFSNEAKASENIRHLEKTEKIGAFLLSLLNSFRTASRGSKERSEWHPEDLAGTIEMSVIIGNVKAKKVGVNLSADQPTARLMVCCDSSQILQILNNLVSNAIDAAAEANAGEKWVRIESLLSQDRVILRVVDSGKGIPEAIRDKLFTKFATTKANDSGTGIGLALSADIIRTIGGTLSLIADAPQTTFQIALPLYEDTGILNVS
jgi:signal transduction histidine kinase/sensor domain CHASE-containing protein